MSEETTHEFNWSGRRVLVTGAGGFIGSHLTERLVQLGASVRAMVRYNSTGAAGWLDSSEVAGSFEVFPGDIRDASLVDEAVAGCDTVFHLAALIAIPYSYKAPSSYVETNVLGTLNVLNAAARHGVRCVVHTSTSEVYGTARSVPITESHPLQGQSPYSASKIGADKLAESFCLSYGTPVAIVRPFNTFGPRQSARAVIPTIIGQLLSGSEVKLGNTTPTRDFNYVENTVSAFVASACSPKAIGQTIHFGSGRETSIGELAHLIAGMMGKPISIDVDAQRLRPRNSEVERLVASNALAQQLLGWTPGVSLEDGLERTIEWLKANIGRYDKSRYAV